MGDIATDFTKWSSRDPTQGVYFNKLLRQGAIQHEGLEDGMRNSRCSLLVLTSLMALQMPLADRLSLVSELQRHVERGSPENYRKAMLHFLR